MIKWASIILTVTFFNADILLNSGNLDSEWKLSKNENQISVYTRHVSYSDYKEFKGEMNVKSNPETIIKLLKNIDDYKNWLPDCIESKRLEKINNTNQINYILTDVPWPFENRDFIYLFSIVPKKSKLEQGKILIKNWSDYIPIKNGIVRIPKSSGLWTLTPIKENLTKVEYQMHVEPGGYVPAWLANLKLVDTPYTFLYNLRDQIEEK